MPRGKPVYHLSDGGRQGHDPTEKNDCAIRAVVHATGLPYADVHAMAKTVGRRHRVGVNTWRLVDLLTKLPGWKVTEEARSWPHPTLAAWLRAHPRGTWILTTYSHALAVKDGVIYDSYPLGLRHRIRLAMQIEKCQQEYVAERYADMVERPNRLPPVPRKEDRHE